MMFRQSIFVTGFPGFIASRLVEGLAKSETQFFLLVQPQFVEKAMADIEEIAAATATPLESFVIVEGDITQPNLGIAAEDLETIQIRNDGRLSSCGSLRSGGRKRGRIQRKSRRHA